MASHQKVWQATPGSRLAAGVIATFATTLIVVAIGLLAEHYAAGSWLASAAQWSA